MNLNLAEKARVTEILNAIKVVEDHGGDIQVVRVRSEEARNSVIRPNAIRFAVGNSVNYPTKLFDIANPWIIKLNNTIPVDYADRNNFTPISLQRLIKAGANIEQQVMLKAKALEELQANPMFGMF